jgi:hypothetical protein
VSEDKMMKNAFRKIWSWFILFLDKMSPKLATKFLHYRVTGSWPNLNPPKDFNEKLQWLKLNEDNHLKARLADKFSVYKHVEDVCGKKILNNLLAVYDSSQEIIWDDLPKKFAIKCTHGAGYNIVTRDKESLNKNEVSDALTTWMEEKFGRRSLEYHYDLIVPKIIVEDYIEDAFGFLPRDYKIYCFNGKAKLVLVCSERDEGLKLDFFDLDWNRLDIGHKINESEKVLERPRCLEEMVKYSELLAKDFCFVRIDFYDRDGAPVFGEFTFTPAANMANYYNEYGLRYLGELLKLG